MDVKYEDIKNHITLIPLEKPNQTIGEKKRERDVVVSIKNGRETKIILEMNVRRKFYETVIRRNLLYLNDVASGGIVSEGYDDLPRTILVNFNTFFIKGRQKLIDEYLFRNKEGEEFPRSDTILNLNIDECYRIL